MIGKQLSSYTLSGNSNRTSCTKNEVEIKIEQPLHIITILLCKPSGNATTAYMLYWKEDE